MTRRRTRSLRPGSNAGQILPVALFAMVTTSAVLIMLFNTGQRVAEKTQAINAADAATYSGAAWTARHLNFMAYTNRAMISNHVAVGHLTSYYSWLEYAENATSAITALSVVPGFQAVGATAQAMNQIVGTAKTLTETAGATLIGVTDLAHQQYYAAQVDARAGLSSAQFTNLMDAVATEYRPSYQVNNGGVIGNLPGNVGTAVQQAVNRQLQVRQGLIEALEVDARGGMLGDLVERTWESNGDLDSWIAGRRGWGPIGGSGPVPVPPIQFRKLGDTQQTLTDSEIDWSGSDQLQQRVWGPQCSKGPAPAWCDWNTIAAGSGSADELGPGSDGYAGMPGYHSLREGSNGPRERVTLPTVAVVSTGPAVLRPRGADLPTGSGPLTIGPTGDPITAAGVSETYFERPRNAADLGTDEEELPNIFNPFWNARRIDFQFLCNQRNLVTACGGAAT